MEAAIGQNLLQLIEDRVQAVRAEAVLTVRREAVVDQVAVHTVLPVVVQAQEVLRPLEAAVVRVHQDLRAVRQDPAVLQVLQKGDKKMKPVKNILFIALALLIFSACTANRIQRSYEEVNNDAETIIIIEHVPEPIFVPQPVIIEQPAPKTKERTNSQINNLQKNKREDLKKDNVRNHTGQRNVNSRGR